MNPAFTDQVVTGNPNQWFNPAAFIAPPSTSGFYSDVGRDASTGPGLASWDFSVFKDTQLSGTARLELRLEVFNLLNRANFNTPNLITHVHRRLEHDVTGGFTHGGPGHEHIHNVATGAARTETVVVTEVIRGELSRAESLTYSRGRRFHAAVECT